MRIKEEFSFQDKTIFKAQLMLHQLNLEVMVVVAEDENEYTKTVF